jgi:nucleoid-associated protein YgaU
MALEKATITNTVTGEVVPVMFNPEEYTVNRDVNYAQTAIPGLSAPLIQFVSGNLQTLEMELFLDTYEEHRAGSAVLNTAGADVRALTSRVTELMSIDPTTHAPPVLLFVWASLSFTCVLARASQRFTMFLADGTPVRANLQVTFNEFRNVDLEAKEIKRETADYSKTCDVHEGETLSSIAAREYGAPQLWRPIALRNGIDKPSGIAVGQRLVVPKLPYRDPLTGEVYAL